MSSLPVPVDPSHFIAYASSVSLREDREACVDLYSKLYFKRGLQIYILRLPLPAPNRRGFINAKLNDIRAFLEQAAAATQGSDMKTPVNSKSTIILTQRVSPTSCPPPSDSAPSTASAETLLSNPYIQLQQADYSELSDPMLMTTSDFQTMAWMPDDPPFTSMTSGWSMDRVEALNGSVSVPEGLLPEALPVAPEQMQTDVATEQGTGYYGSTDGSDSDGMEEKGDGSDDGSYPRKHPQNESPHDSLSLPESFRPLIINGEVQFEVWIIIFLPPTPQSEDGGDIAEDQSEWGGCVGEFSESLVLRDFVQAEVSKERFGLDYKKILEEKKESRKPKRRVIR
ncbi:hypothetical protein EDD21DRAFT_382135 [Dissophora ornata]|nr:hypothetical protein BGZ58_003449 [Dissophora ornata]KAI8598564.1 hypothetical protein EDD21DRAFT_382135 [Dissophora ornata]